MGEGSGPPLLLLHGFGGDINIWVFNQEALSADRTVYALDLPVTASLPRTWAKATSPRS
jgi:pyruvate dehydrogenase E2 component (dihydrolipoamide acetyltransferase)